MKLVFSACSADSLSARGNAEEKSLPGQRPTSKLGAQMGYHKLPLQGASSSSFREGRLYLGNIKQTGSVWFMSHRRMVQVKQMVWKKCSAGSYLEKQYPEPTEHSIKASPAERLYSVLVAAAIWPSLS